MTTNSTTTRTTPSRNPGYLRGIPQWFWLPAFLALAMLMLPLLGMASRVPWADLGSILTTEAAADALILSLRTCLISMVICMVVGTPLALILARASEQPKRPRWLTPIRALVMVPLVMPPVVAGLALLTTFGRLGVLGPTIEAMGIDLAFTTKAVIVAQVFVALPYLVMTVETAAKAAGSHLEHAAASLGASRWVQFSRITAPLLGPSIISGGALAFARCLGEFGATITFAGSMQGTTRTLPLEVYLQREVDSGTAIALSLVLIVLALIITASTSALEARNAKRFNGVPPAETPADSDSATLLADDAGTSAANHTSDDAAPARVATPGFTLQAVVPVRGVDFDLVGQPGQTLALIGPNGSGKSTALRLLAGDIYSPESHIDIARPVGFLDQSPSLFPHLSVIDNVAFGPRCHGVSKDRARERARFELAEVGLSHVADRAPWQLSGGQAQRVALARMLAVDPQLLLLDEPFAALDRSSSASLRRLVQRRTKAGLTCVVVTHDLLDVVVLANRVAVLEGGRLAAEGPMEEVIANPPTDFAATFAGVNMIVGLRTATGLRRESDGLDVHGALSADAAASDDVAIGSRVAAVFEPAAVALRTAPAEGSPRNVWPAVVRSVEAGTSGVDVALAIGNSIIHASVTGAAVSSLGIDVGKELFAEVKAMQVKIIATPA